MSNHVAIEEADPAAESKPPTSGGFLKFYGLYWDRIFWDRRPDTWIEQVERGWEERALLPGVPSGWTGRGTKGLDQNTIWLNFWHQKGVYVLYDEGLVPVYTGQAGLQKGDKNEFGGRTLGDRLREHAHGKYRNGWRYFSWFGFLSFKNEAHLRGKLKSTERNERLTAEFEFQNGQNKSEVELNLLLDSFEAILIEAFAPRFNSRGGNLKGATYVDQFEGDPK